MDDPRENLLVAILQCRRLSYSQARTLKYKPEQVRKNLTILELNVQDSSVMKKLFK